MIPMVFTAPLGYHPSKVSWWLSQRWTLLRRSATKPGLWRMARSPFSRLENNGLGAGQGGCSKKTMVMLRNLKKCWRIYGGRCHIIAILYCIFHFLSCIDLDPSKWSSNTLPTVFSFSWVQWALLDFVDETHHPKWIDQTHHPRET